MSFYARHTNQLWMTIRDEHLRLWWAPVTVRNGGLRVSEPATPTTQLRSTAEQG
jgi:hypothetical protein